MHQHSSVNRIYRLVWNDITGAWIAVAETSGRRGKRSSRRLAALLLSVGAAAAHAGGPTGGQVTAGSGSIAQSGNTTTINQSSQTLSLSWQTFNIAPQQTVDFVQPSSTAVAVNRILGTDGSVILGHLNANGQVYLINPNGVLFGKGAEVNVGGLIASTLDLDPSSAGNTQTFSGTGSGSVFNEGSITAANGGSVALLANHVGNTGTISAQLGTVALGAGSAATLTFSGTHLVSMQVDQSVLNSEVSNGGLIRADGGTVLMTAGAQKALLASVVNNTGVIEARTVQNQQGTITLLGGMSAGTVKDSGTLDASAPGGGNGGSIDTSAAHVQIANSAKVTTAAAMGLNGTWTIDPQDFTIATSGGDETGAQLSSALSTGNVIIDSTAGASGTSGNINVNDAVSWSSNKLTLTAVNDVNINAVMTANNTAKLDLEPGSGNVNMGFKPDGTFAGQVNFFQADGITPRSGTGFLTINGNGYTVITSLGQPSDATTTPGIMTLQGIASVAPVTMSGYSAIPGYYALGANINASVTSGWNGGAGFTPIGIGPYTKAFGGSFDGLGHVISDLTINLPNAAGVGLFAFALGSNGGFVRNVGLTGVAITGSDNVGALVGYGYGTYAGTFPVRNCYATGTVSGATGATPYGVSVGGLIGSVAYGSVTNSHAAVTVSGNGYQNSNTGGLVGTLYAASVNNSYATGAVSNIAIVGSAATNSITGGLVGLGAGGTSSITDSFATGIVTANRNGSGGLVGYMYGSIANSYSTGNVTGGVSGTFGFSTGGLVGFLSGALSNSYETGTVSVTGSGSAGLIGGLVGTLKDTTSITNSFWNATANGSTGYVIYSGTPPHITVTGTSGLTSAQMMAQASYVPSGSAAGQWDFANTWVMYEGQTTPLLQVFMTPLTVSGTITQTYNASAFAPTIGNLNYSIASPDLSQLLGTLTGSGSALGASHAGTYTFTPGGLYSDQFGYIITYAPGSLTINPASLTVTGSTAGKVYDGTTAASLTGGSLSGLFGSDSVTLTQSGSFVSKNAGPSVAINVTDSIGGANVGDYTLVEPTGVTGTITPASLMVSGTSVGSKVYNGSTAASFTGGTLSGLIGNDSVTLTQSGSFATKNVGNGIAVTATDSLSGADAGDYSIVEPAGLSGSITPASLTVSGTSVGSKVYNGTTSAPVMGGTLVGLVSGDSVTLNQSGTFVSANVGGGIAVTATDGLSGADAGDYSIIEPTGLSGSIIPASSGAGSSSASSALVFAALNASTQTEANFTYPQLGATPQVVSASPTMQTLAASPESPTPDATSAPKTVAINVSMRIGATGTLKIENGGLRLPSNLVIGNE
jgi:filamentous hemagglutinin family protein